MQSSFRRSPPLVILLLLTSNACSKKPVSPNPKSPSEPVAVVGHATLTIADVHARLAAQPIFSQTRFESLDRKKEFLDGMIRNELLLQEARRRGLENDPEVRATIEKLLVQKLTRDYSAQQDKSNAIPEADLRRYYDQHKAEFVSPTRIRISHLFLAAPEGDPKRAKAKDEATKLLSQIAAKEAKGQKQVLETTASQRSEDAATKATGGDLGFKTREELAQAWGQPLADAALALKSPNDIGPVVSTSKGIHLIKLLGRHDGYDTPFETARTRIELRLKQQRQTATIDTLVAELKKTTKVTIDEKALAKVSAGLGNANGTSLVRRAGSD